ncbi:MAG: rod shape-determining protein MreD [Termitinemataceae bacterium]|nr:MAG: rod shape-determining protein MreD [Termitinemataceae bacterium]
MTKNIIWASIFILVAGILQSTLLRPLGIYFYAIPDLTLSILVYTAYINGSMTGQLTGFFSGILLDFLSAAPLGLNIFIRTIIGAANGVIKGRFFLDLIFLPMILCAAASLLKAALFFALHFLFAGAVPAYSLSSPVLWVELLFNTVTAPFLFAFLKMFDSLLKKTQHGEA